MGQMGLVEQIVGYDRELGRSPQIAQRLAGQLIQAASRLRAGAALIGVEPPARVSWRVAPAHGRPWGKVLLCVSPRRRVRSKPTPAGPREQRTRRRCSRPPWSSEPCLAVARRRDHASWPLADGDDKTDHPADGLRATETPAFADMPGDGAQELSADLPEEHRSLRRRRSGRALRRRHAATGTRAGADGRRAGAHRHGPDRAWQRACPAMRLVGDPHLRNGVRDENAGAEAGSHRRPSARRYPRQLRPGPCVSAPRSAPKGAAPAPRSVAAVGRDASLPVGLAILRLTRRGARRRLTGATRSPFAGRPSVLFRHKNNWICHLKDPQQSCTIRIAWHS